MIAILTIQVIIYYLVHHTQSYEYIDNYNDQVNEGPESADTN